VTVHRMEGSIFWMEHPDWLDVILRIRVIRLGRRVVCSRLPFYQCDACEFEGGGGGLYPGGVYLVAERLDRAVDCLHLPNGSIRRIGGDD